MAVKRKTQSTRSEFLDIYRGRVLAMDAAELQSQNHPKTDRESYERARYFARRNYLVREMTRARRAFLNYGCRLLPVDPAQKDAVAEWSQSKDGLRASKVLRDAVTEWIQMDCVLAFWMEEARLPATLLAPEAVVYSDMFGLERLKVCLKVDEKQMLAAGIPRDLVARYRRGEVLLSEDADEYFSVLKNERVGHGLGRPRMESAFDVLSECESLEIGENLLASVARTVIRQHVMGHEIKSGPKAGSPVHFLKSNRSKEVKDFFMGRTGFLEFASNFDHEIKLHWIDPKMLSAEKWATIVDRLVWWGGPAALLYLARTIQPYLLTVLRAQCEEDRALLRPFINEVIQTYDPPGPVTVDWSNRCFTEPRVAAELMKFLVQQGPLSLRTALEDSGFDAEEERTRKAEELEDDPKLHLPIFDAAHGDNPGTNDGGGRPPGTPDPAE